MDLALFDFDGTITTTATYSPFIRLAVQPWRKVVGTVLLGPVIAAYHAGVVSQRAIRGVLSRVVFWREDPDRITALGARFAAEVLPTVLRAEALERIAWHRARGDRIVVVSASLDVYLDPWCRAMDVEVICSRLETREGRYTGRYLDGDCCGEVKTQRIRERYALSDYETIYAYGDTDEDGPILAMADRPYFRWKALAGALLMAVVMGCGDSRAPTPPTPPPGVDPGCGLGPVPIETGGPEPCTTVVGRCPQTRPHDARSFVWVGTCSFTGRDGACQPIQLPGCPRQAALTHFLLVNPTRGPDRPCPSGGELTIDARTSEEGGARVLWDAQDLDEVTCRHVGAEREGELSVEGPCCRRVLDVYYPRNDFTFRVEIRTDWQR
jgi:phosphatidylglycerophosphatase C